jgi:hypothetical protein
VKERMRRSCWLSRAARLMQSAVREIFDEAAYERFLIRQQLPVSAESYAQFLDEQAAATARRPRCC